MNREEHSQSMIYERDREVRRKLDACLRRLMSNVWGEREQDPPPYPSIATARKTCEAVLDESEAIDKSLGCVTPEQLGTTLEELDKAREGPSIPAKDLFDKLPEDA